jgi:hypothetical protein
MANRPYLFDFMNAEMQAARDARHLLLLHGYQFSLGSAVSTRFPTGYLGVHTSSLDLTKNRRPALGLTQHTNLDI